ncbi:MAG: hypothetical protein AAB091_06320 [Elusimicrobiota bacterium]
MRTTKEVCRLKFACYLSNRQIAKSLGIGRTTVADYLGRAQAAGLADWPAIETIGEEELEQKLFSLPLDNPSASSKPLPDYARVHEELRNSHVTLTLLWQEHKEQHPDSHGYTQFAHYYSEYKKKLGLVMRQEHKAGEKVFVDYCDGLGIIDPDTGEIVPTQLFVGVWGASNYTYAEASRSQDLACWTMSHVRAFEYFNRVPVSLQRPNLRKP